MAKIGINNVERALEKGFRSKGAKVRLFTEKSDYKDFIRMFVVSDFFRRKSEKERLGEVFSMLEENGAKDAIIKISVCIALTEREYEKEFGRDVFLGVDLHRTAREMKSAPKSQKLAMVRARS